MGAIVYAGSLCAAAKSNHPDVALYLRENNALYLMPPDAIYTAMVQVPRDYIPHGPKLYTTMGGIKESG